MDRRFHIHLLVAALMIAGATSVLSAQHLHTNDRWDECAIVIDPMLTQDAWHQFVGEAAHVIYFRPLTSAKPLGKWNVEVSVLNTASRIDDADAAWNDTFSHPDSTHWLFEGSALAIPGLMVRMGVSDRMDVGAYFTKNLNANYGIAGGQVQYSLVNDAIRKYAVAGRLTVATLFGPDDLTASVAGADVLVSKDVSIFTPYAGVSGYLSHGHERTTKVDLDDEHVLGAQGTLGVTARVSLLRLGAEVNVARVTGYAFKIGFAPRSAH